MKERLEIHNFGPIESVKLELTKLVVLIGPQSSGKSTIAKLITILRSIKLVVLDIEFNNLLKDYNIHSYLRQNTLIAYTIDAYSFTYKNGISKLEINKNHPISSLIYEFEKLESENPRPRFDIHSKQVSNQVKELENLITGVEKKSEENEDVSELIKKAKNQIEELRQETQLLETRKKYNDDILQNLLRFVNYSAYIPAERILVSHLIHSLATIMKNKIPIQQNLLDFISDYETARNEISNFSVDSLGLKYLYKDNSESIVLKNGQKVSLTAASSGTQNLVPLLLTVEKMTSEKELGRMFVIEEPEINLFPVAQKQIIYYIIRKILSQSLEGENLNELVITTHSPYILASLNNLAFASFLGHNTQIRNRVSKIIEPSLWISVKDFSAYFVSEGKIKNIIDNKTGLIAENELDSASDYINDDFQRLIEVQLQYQNGLSNKKKTSKLSRQ